MEKLTKQKGEALGFHRNTVADLIKRGAVIVDGMIYAPVKRRNLRIDRHKRLYKVTAK